MASIPLLQLAHARSGDKGDTANVGVIALRPEFYPVLVEQLTTERVKRHFEGICLGEVERFELPNLHALNFLLHNSLGGGGNGVTENGCTGEDAVDGHAPHARRCSRLSGSSRGRERLMGGGVLRAETEGSVGWLTLDRPEKRNALNDALIDELLEGVAKFGRNPAVKAVGLRGAGKDFCAGADLASLRKISEADLLENVRDVDRLAELFLQLRRCPKPVVAVVHGRALAGGCGLATACDMVIAAESARFGYPEANLGFVPAMVMAILRRNVSEKRAFELITLGEQIDARAAERLGLVNRVVPDDRLDAAAAELLGKLSAQSTSALLLCKRLLYQQDGLTFEGALRAGADVNVLARYTDDMQAGLQRFLQRDE